MWPAKGLEVAFSKYRGMTTIRRLAPPLNAIVREDVEEGSISLNILSSSFLENNGSGTSSSNLFSSNDNNINIPNHSPLVNPISYARGRRTDHETTRSGYRLVWAENVKTKELVPVQLRNGGNDDSFENENIGAGERQCNENDGGNGENLPLLPPPLYAPQGKTTNAMDKLNQGHGDSSSSNRRGEGVSMNQHVNIVVLMRACYLFFQVS